MALSKPWVTNFCSVYEDALKKQNISPTRIYNVNESDLSTFQKKTKDICTNWKTTGGSFDKCGQGDTCDIGLLYKCVWTLYSSNFDFPLQNLEKLAH